MSNDLSQFNQVFFDESLDLINDAEQLLIKIDCDHVKAEDIDAIFRCAHTIKSSSAMLGFTGLSQFTHKMEDYLDRVRNKEKSLTSESIDILFKCHDFLRTMINNLKMNKAIDEAQTHSFEKQIEHLISVEKKVAVKNESNHDPASTLNAELSTIRVSTEKVDALINMVGELVITQSMLTQISNNFDESKLPALKEGFAHLEHNCRELQENIMRIRMLPISYIFNRFPRMVREFSKEMNKSIHLQINGENTELDKTILEKIGDPLIHLIRNALDHGIESHDERTQTGKPSEGQLNLNAYHQGSHVIIEVKDDGRGLNPEKILLKAKEKGLVGDHDVLSDDQIFNFIFLPGFSTAEKVSDISGRGVGMDVVKKNIESLGGKVDVKSSYQQGTTFTLYLPLTMAIIDGQLLRIAQSTYVMPLANMIETIQIKHDLVHQLSKEAKIYTLRGKHIPIINLANIFNIEDKSITSENQLLVIVEVEKEQYGILIDELLQLQQVVIKSIEQNYKNVAGISGATILGDGTIALILDPSGIISAASGYDVQHKTVA